VKEAGDWAQCWFNLEENPVVVDVATTALSDVSMCQVSECATHRH